MVVHNNCGNNSFFIFNLHNSFIICINSNRRKNAFYIEKEKAWNEIMVSKIINNNLFLVFMIRKYWIAQKGLLWLYLTVSYYIFHKLGSNLIKTNYTGMSSKNRKCRTRQISNLATTKLNFKRLSLNKQNITELSKDYWTNILQGLKLKRQHFHRFKRRFAFENTTYKVYLFLGLSSLYKNWQQPMQCQFILGLIHVLIKKILCVDTKHK